MNIEFAFANLEQLISMEGHGPYVWASYAITFSVIVLLSLVPVFRCRAFLKSQKAAIAREELDSEQA